MYVQVFQPAPPPPSWLCRTLKVGCPAPVTMSPDALADVLTGVKPAGMAGCGGACKCGGKCKGVGDVAPDSTIAVPTFGTPAAPAAAPPSFFQELTNPFGSDLSVLSQQLADLNAQTAAVNANIASSNWGTWVLVGLGAMGAWWAYKQVSGLARLPVSAPRVVRRRRTTAKKGRKK